MPEWAGSYGKYFISAQRHIDAALMVVKNRRVVVQAGGHVGQFPVYLAKHFDTVYTWEPMPNDFRDLVSNLNKAGVLDKVFVSRGMLGSKQGTGLMKDGGSGSSRRQREAVGPCPIYRVDDIQLPVCDLIYLDVEGDESEILHGALETIKRCHPVVVAEERGKGNHSVGVPELLESLGYKKVSQWMADSIWEYQ